MTVRDLVETIRPQNVPIHYHTDIDRKQLFSTRVRTAEELPESQVNDSEDKPLGVFLLNLSVEETYDLFVAQNAANVEIIESKITHAYTLEPTADMKYLTVLFLILHELGHWMHFIHSGLSGKKYWEKYGYQEDDLYKFYYIDRVSHPQDLEKINRKYALTYRELPMEAIADSYALREMLPFL